MNRTLIKGKKPRVCAECENWHGCFSKADYRHSDGICGWCMYIDAVEIPAPHGDLIDRNAIIERILNIGEFHDPMIAAVVEAMTKALIVAIKDIPAVIEAEDDK